MVIVIDIGNTLIKIALYDKEIKDVFKINTNPYKTSDEYAKLIRELCSSNNIEGAAISSVVPLLTNEIKDAIKKVFSIDSFILTPKTNSGLNYEIDHPDELGCDLICGAVGAIKKYGYPIVVADLGTATKMMVVDKNKNFIGGMISSGTRVNLEALVNKTAQLMETPIEAPEKVIGKNTIDCIKSGIVFGQAYMISEFARRMEKELGYELKRVLTGGFSSIIKEQVVCFNYEPNLVLDGLFEIYKLNK